MKKRDPRPYDSAAYERADDYLKNRLLLDWLGDDGERAKFYAAQAGRRVFAFPSRAEDPPADFDPTQPGRPRPPLRAHLVLDRALVEQVLRDDGTHFSNLPYGRIGSGGFMLALDPAATPAHGLQREVAMRVFGSEHLPALCTLATRQAGALALAVDGFDLAAFAEATALRFCSLYFGFALKDYPLLEAATRAAYAALNQNNLGRHFVTDPLVLPQAAPVMGLLARRCAELLDAYAMLPAHEWPEDGIAPEGLPSYQPVLRKLAGAGGQPMTGSELAVLVLGTLAGTVGNIQAMACIAVDALLDAPDWRDCSAEETQRRCHAAWRANPPVPFLPRRVLQADATWHALGVQAGDELVLAIGAATSGPQGDAHAHGLDPLVFTQGFTHDCLGRYLGLPLVMGLVRHVLALPGLDRRCDPLLGTPMRLEKRWGFACTRLPLTHRRQQLRMQQPLNVSMRVKAPIAENAAKLREVLRVAAPRIDQSLREAGMVHFAWFEFTDLDSQLVLHTVYDGDFDAYVDHFALSVGDLFDSLFEYLEPAPPRPISDYPLEFLAMIKRFNRAPAGGYFFSAYPALQTQQALRFERQQTARPVAAPAGSAGAST